MALTVGEYSSRREVKMREAGVAIPTIHCDVMLSRLESSLKFRGRDGSDRRGRMPLDWSRRCVPLVGI